MESASTRAIFDWKLSRSTYTPTLRTFSCKRSKPVARRTRARLLEPHFIRELKDLFAERDR
jgi:hypothetical protein